MLSALLEPFQRLRQGRSLLRIPAPVLGMLIAHIGVGVAILGVTVVSAYSIERDGALAVGDTTTLRDYTLRLDNIEQVTGPNYLAERATLTVTRGDRTVAVLTPEKRRYLVQTQPMTEAGIHGRLSRDLFVAMGEPLGDGAWSFRFQYKPFVRLIWLGAIIMAAGGGISLAGRRRKRQTAAASTDATAIKT